MADELIKQVMEENQKLRSEITILKSIIKSLRTEIQNVKSDAIVEQAMKRNRP